MSNAEKKHTPIYNQPFVLTEETARRIEEILADPNYPTHAGKEMPTAGPEVVEALKAQARQALGENKT